MYRQNRRNRLLDVHQASFEVCLFSLEPTLKIRLENIRQLENSLKQPAQKNRSRMINKHFQE